MSLEREEDLIRWLEERCGHQGLIGDDAAILPRSETWAVTVDSQIQGVHFPSDLDVALVARRLLAVNLSDIAAMGAQPVYAFLALAAPKGFDHRAFLDALVADCEKFSVALAGGDLAHNTQLTASLTLLGRKPTEQRWLRRSTGRAGEHLWVGGSLGEAALGLVLYERGARLLDGTLSLPGSLELDDRTRQLAIRALRRFLLPTPQLKLGAWLGRRTSGAALDLSDGLAKDLHRLCAASHVGAEVDFWRLPVAPELSVLAAQLAWDGRQGVLAGGEDYVLLFTLPADEEPPSSFGCTRIGKLVSDPDIVLIEGAERQALASRGWDHLQPFSGGGDTRAQTD